MTLFILSSESRAHAHVVAACKRGTGLTHRRDMKVTCKSNFRSCMIRTTSLHSDI